MMLDFFGSETAGKILYFLLRPVSYFASHMLFMAIGFMSGIMMYKAGAKNE